MRGSRYRRHRLIRRAVVEALCVTLLSSAATVFGLWLAFGH
jgi:hypothetical protein